MKDKPTNREIVNQFFESQEQKYRLSDYKSEGRWYVSKDGAHGINLDYHFEELLEFFCDIHGIDY